MPVHTRTAERYARGVAAAVTAVAALVLAATMGPAGTAQQRGAGGTQQVSGPAGPLTASLRTDAGSATATIPTTATRAGLTTGAAVSPRADTGAATDRAAPRTRIP